MSSKTCLLLTILLLAALLQESSSTHLKTKAKVQSKYINKGLCWAKLWQNQNWKVIGTDPVWISTRHGQCTDLNYVGNTLNDDTDYLDFDGDCDTCSVQVFDDANLSGDSHAFNKRDCGSCALNDWSERISSVKFCCTKKPKSDYSYRETCRAAFRQDKLVQLNKSWLSLDVEGGRCVEKSYVGNDYNDNIDQFQLGSQCLDCTVQLFDDADFKGDSKTIKAGSSECPLTNTGVLTCGMGGWDDRVSSIKVCCPVSIV